MCFMLYVYVYAQELISLKSVSYHLFPFYFPMEPVKPNPKKRQRNEIANEIKVQADPYEFQERMTR